jgi:curli biogenesis system outer membrane secretion channel CsgG
MSPPISCGAVVAVTATVWLSAGTTADTHPTIAMHAKSVKKNNFFTQSHPNTKEKNVSRPFKNSFFI